MIWEPVRVCNSGVSDASAARGSVMLFIGMATLFSTALNTAADDSLRWNCELMRALKLKNPRTSVGAGAFDWAEVLNQPATAPGLMSPGTGRTTRPTTLTSPDAHTTPLAKKAECGVMEAVPA